MALRLRRGTNTERLQITPLQGELIYTIDTKLLYVGDGTTAGGILVTGSDDEGITRLAELTDTDITGVEDGDVLTWNNSTGKWEPLSIIAAQSGIVEGSNYRINIASDDSTIMVDTALGQFNGTLFGSVIGTLDGEVTGSVFADDSTLLVDGVSGFITGDVLNSSIQTDEVDLAILRIGGEDGLGNKAGIRITTDGSGTDDYDLFNIFSYHDDAVNPAISTVLRGRGTPAEPTAIQDNDPIHAQVFAARDSNGDNLPAVLVKVSTEGTTGVGIIPGVYEILVTDSAGTLTPAFKVDSEQNATVTGTSIANIMQCAVLTSAPGTPAEGMIAVADGNAAGWDPKGTDGGTSYPCYYDGSAWNALF